MCTLIRKAAPQKLMYQLALKKHEKYPGKEAMISPKTNNYAEIGAFNLSHAPKGISWNQNKLDVVEVLLKLHTKCYNIIWHSIKWWRLHTFSSLSRFLFSLVIFQYERYLIHSYNNTVSLLNESQNDTIEITKLELTEWKQNYKNQPNESFKILSVTIWDYAELQDLQLFLDVKCWTQCWTKTWYNLLPPL